jgi:diguanylate cyclase (GGDEF)-like protein
MIKLDISVLYVEDDLSISEEISFFLQPRVRTLLVAHDGAEALELFEKHQPEMIITDIQMPRLNGLEMIKTIRAENVEVPIIITSAYNDSNYLMESLNHRVDAYLLKPIDLIELYTRLQKLAKPLLLKRELQQSNDRLKEINNSLEEKIFHETQLRTQLLNEKQEFLQSVVNGIDDPIMVIDTNYSITLMNNSAQKMLDNGVLMNPKDRQCFEVSHHRDSPCEGENYECPLHSVMISKKNVKVIHNHQSADDLNIKYFEISATPLFDKSGEVKGIIEVSRDITGHLNKQQELEIQKNQMQQYAYYDALTGLSSRMYFFEFFKEAVKKANRDHRSIHLLFIDLDNFKEINDKYGHDIGDIVLQRFSNRLKTSVRESDHVVRLGGDEFVIMISDIKYDQNIEKLIQKIIDEVSKSFEVKGYTFDLTCSIGVSSYPQDGKDLKTLLRHADLAMYEVKKEGKNGFQIYHKIKE